MSLRDNHLHVLRVNDEDPGPNDEFQLVLVTGGIELRRATKPGGVAGRKHARYHWTRQITTRELELRSLETAVRELEVALNVFRLQIETLEPVSRGGKPQPHVRDVLHAVLAGMRKQATLGFRRELALASVDCVTRIVVRTQVITNDVAEIAAAREAGHPAVQ